MAKKFVLDQFVARYSRLIYWAVVAFLLLGATAAHANNEVAIEYQEPTEACGTGDSVTLTHLTVYYQLGSGRPDPAAQTGCTCTRFAYAGSKIIPVGTNPAKVRVDVAGDYRVTMTATDLEGESCYSQEVIITAKSLATNAPIEFEVLTK